MLYIESLVNRHREKYDTPLSRLVLDEAEGVTAR